MLSLSVAAVATTGLAFAQTAEAPAAGQRGATSSEDIIVTATRRSVRLQDVPISITAFTQAELTEKGAVGYEGLSEVPGVVLNRPSANFNNFTARGIATNGYNANLQSAVAIYIDELPISANGNSTILDPSLFDVERVEFLRGPQGTLFGSGSLAGALRILTKAPDPNEFSYSGVVDFGLTGSDSYRQRYNAMVNFPLVEDTLALRLVGFYRNEEGYLDNIGTGVHNSNTLKSAGVRGSLLANFTDRMSLRLTASHEDSQPEDSSLIDPRLGEERRVSDRPDRFTGLLQTLNATVTYDFDGADLTSSSTYALWDQEFIVDLAGTFGGAIAFALDAYAYDDIFVQESRLASDPGGVIDWVVGGFYYYKRRDVDFNYRSNPAFLALRRITGLSDEYYQRFGNYTVSHELAGFGELTYRIGDNFWLTGGMRYSSTDVQTTTEPGGYTSNYLTLAILGLSGPVTITPVASGTGAKAEEAGPSYKASASYRLAPSITTYATYSTGFRTPVVNGFAGRVSLVNPNDIVIPAGADSDNLRNYEAGLKGRWFDGDLTANLALYQIDWENIQVQANRTSDSVQFATNIGAARSRGFEFEIGASPIEGLDIRLNGAINDAKVTALTPSEAAISGAVVGARLASPRFQGALTVRYSWDVGADGEAFVGGTLSHVGSYPGMFPNVPGNPNARAPTYAFTESYENLNLSAGATFGPVMIIGYVENVTDDHSITYVHPEAFIASRFGTLRPRTIGIRLGYNL
ncbi:MAG: TonB-dependent receptor [Hyphomonadaceae bacterium]|nr:TonB-dependent receptor [Hyphomonadaceae bacterium]